MRKLLATALLMIILLPCGAFGQILEWDRTFGGANGDYGESLQRTTDGGFIIAGYTTSYGAGGPDVWLIKTDANGIEQWNRTFGGASSDYGYDVQQTTDGGFIIAGSTHSFGAGYRDVWLIKTDANGIEQWNRTFGGPKYEEGYSVQQTADGGFIIAGYTDPSVSYDCDVWLIKTDSLGNEQWSKTFGGSSDDFGSSVRQTTDGGFIIAGHTFSFGATDADVWLVKTDSLGNEQWNETFGMLGEEQGESVRQTADGGFIIVGQTSSFGAGSYDVLLIKTDADGNEEWSRTFGGASEEHGYDVQEAADGGFIIAGSTYSFGAGSYDVWLIRTDTHGNEVWSETFGGAEADVGYSVQQTVDGGFAIAGYTMSYGADGADVWLIKTYRHELSAIDLKSPLNKDVLTSPPTFAWSPIDGLDNIFAVDLSLRPDFATYYSTYKNLHIPIEETTLTMPDSVWARIPHDTTVYWRVRGLDRAAEPPTIITSTGVWSFYKD